MPIVITHTDGEFEKVEASERERGNPYINLAIVGRITTPSIGAAREVS